jgi:HEXXH motif-containing protein
LSHGFSPTAARGEGLDAAVRGKLAASICALADAVDGRLDADLPALRALATAVADHPVSPAVVAAYSACVPLLFGGDRVAAEGALARLADPALRLRAAPRVTTLDDALLGSGMAEAYAAAMGVESEARFAAIPRLALGDAARRLAEARALLGASFTAEIDAVAHEIVAVAVAPGGELLFHGATSFLLWGALLLNLDAHPTRVKLAEGLAHESGHAVLFGLTMGAPLVTNPDDERHPSPLRHDPRPMDGITHAVWVLARMHLAMEVLLAGDALTHEERTEAEVARTRIARDYRDGLAVVDAHARFTPEGAAAFDLARGYMLSAAGSP